MLTVVAAAILFTAMAALEDRSEALALIEHLGGRWYVD